MSKRTNAADFGALAATAMPDDATRQLFRAPNSSIKSLDKGLNEFLYDLRPLLDIQIPAPTGPAHARIREHLTVCNRHPKEVYERV